MKRTANELKLSYFRLVAVDGVIYSGEWSEIKKYLPKSTLIRIIKAQAAGKIEACHSVLINQKIGSDIILSVKWESQFGILSF